MKFTLGWLKEHLETDASLNEITDKLTALGLELEEVEDPAEKFAPFKVAYVEKAEKHPDADRLNVCIVDTGTEKVQVVCGAPNAKTGMKAIFAPAGSYVPGTDMTLKKGNIRGQDSNGMLVSEREMGLSDEHDGIIELAEDAKIGTPFSELYGLDDPIIDIALTPNRADCAGILGIARDLAAAGMGTLKPLKNEEIKGDFKSPVDVSIEAKTECPIFFGRYIKNVENKPSPDWMQKRLKAIGLRPISALVDITNYVSMDLCRPLHVFDADKLQGNIHVRMGKGGEELEALNDKSYKITDAMTVVADDSGALALGGIVGGVSTGCTEGTTNVFVECAYFDPYTTAKTGRALQIDSDARYRFERGVDPEFTRDGIEIATQLILELCGGEVSEVVSDGAMPKWQREVDFDFAYTKKLSSLDVPEKRQTEILESLGFGVKGNKISPPSWRGDIDGKADIVEEVVRVVGYDKIEAVSVRSAQAVSGSAETLEASRKRKARGALSTRGMYECVTYSFLNKELAENFKTNDKQELLTLQNPISNDLNQMRPSIVPNLIQAAQNNADRGNVNNGLFEVGPIFPSAKPDAQLSVATGIRFGTKAGKHWSGAEANRNLDIYDAKADAIAALEAVGVSTGNLQVSREAAGYYHPGRSGALKQGKNILAQFGEFHPAVLEEMDVKANIVGFEVFLDNVPAGKNKGFSRPLLKASQFQPVSRDFAFIVDEHVEADAIARTTKNVDRQLIAAVEVFDVYQGKGVDEGKKSVAIKVVIQPVKQTLTDAEIESISQKIIGTVSDKTGATLRG